MLSCFSRVLTLCDSTDCSPPGCSVPGLSKQEYWSGLLRPPPEDLPDSGTEPITPVAPALQAESWPLIHLGNSRLQNSFSSWADWYIYCLQGTAHSSHRLTLAREAHLSVSPQSQGDHQPCVSPSSAAAWAPDAVPGQVHRDHQRRNGGLSVTRATTTQIYLRARPLPTILRKHASECLQIHSTSSGTSCDLVFHPHLSSRTNPGTGMPSHPWEGMSEPPTCPPCLPLRSAVHIWS